MNVPMIFDIIKTVITGLSLYTFFEKRRSRKKQNEEQKKPTHVANQNDSSEDQNHRAGRGKTLASKQTVSGQNYSIEIRFMCHIKRKKTP